MNFMAGGRHADAQTGCCSRKYIPREKLFPFTVFDDKIFNEKALQQMQLAARLPNAAALWL
jgi:hypothetical protein